MHETRAEVCFDLDFELRILHQRLLLNGTLHLLLDKHPLALEFDQLLQLNRQFGREPDFHRDALLPHRDDQALYPQQRGASRLATNGRVDLP